MSESPSQYMSPEEFFENAQPTSVFEDAVKELTELRDSEVVDQDQVRLNETWTLLAHQVVGQESF
jgi:hypothetical protein